jgi:hypothetical protein
MKMLKSDDLVALLREECERAGSQRKWAHAHGMSQAYVSDVLFGRRSPGALIQIGLGVINRAAAFEPVAEPALSYAERPE